MISCAKISIEILCPYQLIYRIWRPANVARLRVTLLKGDGESVCDVQLHRLSEVPICIEEGSVTELSWDWVVIQVKSSRVT